MKHKIFTCLLCVLILVSSLGGLSASAEASKSTEDETQEIFDGILSYHKVDSVQAWIDGGCLASEMETAALFTVSATLGIRSGAVLRAVWNQERVNMGIIDPDDSDELSAARCAVEAMRILVNQ